MREKVSQTTNVIAPPRRFAGIDDFQRMQNLLVTGRKAQNGSYYVHVGDLSWWLYYIDADQALMNHAYLWESPQRPGELDGWALLTPDWRSFDVFVRPELRGSTQAQAMYAWGEARISEIAAAQGKQEIYTIWVSAHDPLLAAYLVARGFERHPEYHIQLECSLNADIPLPLLPPGYQVRNVGAEDEAEQRAAASYAAFQSEKPWESYLRRYIRFMRSPVYREEHDLVVAAPDGRIASFCIIWLDEVNKVGLFEPVGTHPDFHRMGLGKALMLAGLQRMQAQGMRAAIVNTEHDNLPAIGLYRSAGFEIGDELLTYFKRGLK